MEAYETEATALGVLREVPNVVVAYDAGITPSNVAFLALGFCDGPDARQWVKSDGASINDVISISVKIANAIVAVHSRGVIHGDVKPGNILMSGIEPVLSDFGQACFIETLAPSQPRRVAAAFSPAYAAPELVTGALVVPDAACEVYSLASTVWSLLEGHPPRVYSGRSNDVQAMLRRAVRTEVPQVSRVPIPEELNDLLGRGLSVEPRNRPTAIEFAWGLEDLAKRFRVVPARRAESTPPVDREPSPWWGETLLGPAMHVAFTTPRTPDQSRSKQSSPVSIDGVVAILTALPDEMVAATRHLKDRKTVTSGLGVSYTRGTFSSNGRNWSVICACVGPGNITTAMVVQQTSLVFDPDLLAFIGVAGGLKDVSRGDVVVASRVIGYESGKQTKDMFLPRPPVFATDFRLMQLCTHVSLSRQWRNRLPKDARGDWSVFIKPIVAGEKVLASQDAELVRDIRRNHGDAVAVEMEGLGLYAGASFCQSVPAVSIRGVSDLLSGKRPAADARWQPRAAATAAAFFFEMLATLSPEHLGHKKNDFRRTPGEVTVP